MDLHDKIVCKIFFNLVQDPVKHLWHYRKKHKCIYTFYMNKSFKDVPLAESRGFCIKYNRSLYHIIGLDKFNKKGNFNGLPVYVAKSADGYPIIIMDNNGHIVKKVLILVNSKYFKLGHDTRKLLIENLESFDKNLSKDTNIRKLEPVYYMNDKYNLSIFSVINLLRNSKYIRLLFHELIKHPYLSLNKAYFQSSRPKREDNRSIKLNIISPKIKRFSFYRRINYDNEENRWMKYILERLINLSARSIKYIRYSKRFSFWPKRLFIKSLKKLCNYLVYINHETFLRNVSSHISRIPSKFIYLYRYFLIYKKYNELFNNRIYIMKDIKYLTHYRYSYSIKPTSKLYELWTCIYILKILIYSGFNLYGLKYLNKKISLVKFLNQGLLEGTTFCLKRKDGVYLNIVYNVHINLDSKSPVYVFNNHFPNMDRIHSLRKLIKANNKDHLSYKLHDKPDIRIDIFNHHLYEGGIILDAKCKNKKSVNTESSDVSQLISYQYHVNYKLSIIDKYPNYFKFLHINPIQRVFVLFAGVDYRKDRNIFGIKYCKLIPKAHYKIKKDKILLLKVINNCNRVITTLNNKFRAR